MKEYRFYREENDWFIDLPEYLAQGGSKADLAMVAGADTMLERIAGKNDAVVLKINIIPFEGADELIRTEICDPVMGGGYYHMKKFENQPVNQDMWLCDVTRFIFGNIPPKLFIKQVK